LGNHKWNIYRGILTRKAKIEKRVIRANKVLVIEIEDETA
jgi:hypothetical protein